MDNTRRNVLLSAGAVGTLGALGFVRTRLGQAGDGEDAEFETIRVPDDEPTIQDGVDAAGHGDLVLVSPGTYEEQVDVATHDVTIRGTDRNEVILDGEFERSYGVHVEANGVAVENLTARHFAANGFYWRYVDGFRGSYLTAYNNGDYGIYAYRSTDGRFEYSYASGHPDAGFYLGRNQPFEATITDCVAEGNAFGYSGTSTGEGLTIRDSVWRENGTGIAPNTLDESDPPEHASTIVGNEVYENDNEDAPNKELTYPCFGMGIVLWGGSDNVVEDNEVRDHEHFGVVAEPNVAEPSGNAIRNNDICRSGEADIALGAPAGEGNRFVDNAFLSSLPADIEEAGDGAEGGVGEGSAEVSAVFERQAEAAEDMDFPDENWQEYPTPDDRPNMPDPTDAPPRPAEEATSVGDED